MAGRHLEGRDEPIIEPDLPIIDTHHHFFVRPGVRYLFDDYLADVSAGHAIRASVYVETRYMARADGPEVMRPLGEVEFANGMAAMAASGVFGPARIAAAIVGHADLTRGGAVEVLLDRYLQSAPDRIRGVRQIAMSHPDPAVFAHLASPPPAGILERASFREGFRALAPRGLAFDAAVLHPQLPELAALADAFPDTVIVLNHIGLAVQLDPGETARAAVFEDWRGKLADLARRPNVTCKIGGLGSTYWGFGFDQGAGTVGSKGLAEAWKPYVETGIELFGADRCMMESNYPPDGRSCGFVPLWNALKRITAGCSADQKSALYSRTAARVYRIQTGQI